MLSVNNLVAFGNHGYARNLGNGDARAVVLRQGDAEKAGLQKSDKNKTKLYVTHKSKLLLFIIVGALSLATPQHGNRLHAEQNDSVDASDHDLISYGPLIGVFSALVEVCGAKSIESEQIINNGRRLLKHAASITGEPEPEEVDGLIMRNYTAEMNSHRSSHRYDCTYLQRMFENIQLWYKGVERQYGSPPN